MGNTHFKANCDHCEYSTDELPKPMLHETMRSHMKAHENIFTDYSIIEVK